MAQRILIVDDSQPIHTLVKARLADEPVELISAYDGESAIHLAGELQPDLVLLDVDMPVQDGFEVCRRLKSTPDTLAIPIIFLTGAASTEEKIKGLELGAVDYITKPFDPAELRARVRATLRTKYLMDLLAKKAMIDGLTGLWNRAYFEQRFSQESSSAIRAGRPLSLVITDVDHFKSVNDAFGHPAGDDVLRGVAQTIQEQCRTEDVVCRYGGEEFVIIAPNISIEGAHALAERIRLAVASRAVVRRSGEIRVTCSFGVADREICGTAGMLEAADRALYHAKFTGRNRVILAARNAAAHAA